MLVYLNICNKAVMVSLRVFLHMQIINHGTDWKHMSIITPILFGALCYTYTLLISNPSQSFVTDCSRQRTSRFCAHIDLIQKVIRQIILWSYIFLFFQSTVDPKHSSRRSTDFIPGFCEYCNTSVRHYDSGLVMLAQHGSPCNVTPHVDAD